MSETKVIAIKLPFDLQERLASFPFLHALREEYPEADFHLITPKMQIEVLNLLPFKAYYHEFEEKEIETIFDTHPFAVNAKIYNVDLFINLTNSFADAALGLSLRAKKRLGFSDGWKTLVLNEKTTRPLNHHLTEDYFALFKTHFNKDVNPRLRVMSRDLAPIVQEFGSEPFIAVNLSPLVDVDIDAQWIELFELFENQKFVLFASEDEVKVQLLMKRFIERLPKQNQYVNFAQKDWIELGRMLAQARGVITYNGPAASLSAYVGSRTLILFDREDPKRTGPFYFLADVATISVEDPNYGEASTKETVLKPRKRFITTAVFEKACEFLRL